MPKFIRAALGGGTAAPVFLLMASTANALQFIYQVSMARLLEPDQYTLLLALVSFVGIMLFPGHAFQSAVAVGVGALLASGQVTAVWRFTVRAGSVGAGVALLLGVILALLANQLRALFGFSDNWVLTLLLVILPLSMLLATARGALQGLGRFAWLGSNLLLDASLRVLLAIGLVVAGFGLTGALAGFSLGIAAAIGLGIWVIRPRATGTGSSGDIRALLIAQLATVPATFAIFGAQSVDVIIANWRFSGVGLEPFVAAAFAGRVSFHGCFMVSQLLLPRLRDMFAEPALNRRLLLRGSLAVAVMALGPLLLALLLPSLLHEALVGPNYASDPKLLQVYLGGAALLSFSLYLVYILIAARITWVAWGLVPVAVGQTLAYLLLANSAYDLAVILLLSAAAMCAICAVAGARLFKRSLAAARSP